MLKLNKILFLFIIFIIIICFFIFSNFFSNISNFDNLDEGKIGNNDFLNVGIIIPKSNNLISAGLSVLDIYNYSFNQINLNGGINGKQVRLFIEDGACSELGGEIAAKNLLENYSVDLVIGGVCSETTLGAARVMEQNKKILINSLSNSHQISNSGDFIFRTANSNSIYSKALAEEIFFSGGRNVAILIENSSYGDSYWKTFEIEFEKFGGSINYFESFDIFDNDFDYVFYDISLIDVDTLIMFFLNDAFSSSFVTQLYNSNSSLNLYFGDVMASNYMLKNLGDKMEGMKLAGNHLNLTDVKINNLVSKINNFSGVDVTLNLPISYVISSYELPLILKQVIEKNNCDFNNSICIRDALYYMEKFDSLFGEIYFDINGDIDGIFPEIYIIKNSSIVPIN